MTKTTVSQCLRKIAPLKAQLKLYKNHAESAVLYDKKDPQAFEFHAEMNGFTKALSELLRLQTALAVSNATNHIEWEGKQVLLAWAVRYLEELKGLKAWVDCLPVSSSEEKTEENYVTRYSGGVAASFNEPRTMLCALPEAKRFAMSQKLQEEFNSLNDLVETSNHRVFIEET